MKGGHEVPLFEYKNDLELCADKDFQEMFTKFFDIFYIKGVTY